jgi:hypothetical protein
MLSTAVLLLALGSISGQAPEPAPTTTEPPAAAAPAAAPDAPPAAATPVAEPAPAPAPDSTPPSEPKAPEAPAAAAPAPAKAEPMPVPEGWEDLHEELEMTADGGVDVCEALSLPLSLIPGVGDAVGTVTEWLCIIPAAIAVDTVALQYGGRDATVWQATVALLSQKLFEDLIDTPLTIAVGVGVVGAVAVLAGSAAYQIYVDKSFPIFLPTLAALGVGTLLITPVALLKKKGGEALADWIFFGLTNQLYGEELEEKKKGAYFQPGDEHLKPGGWARVYVLMATAGGTKGDTGLLQLIPVAGPFFKAADDAAATKERMRRVGRDVLRDPPGRDLSSMDTAVDVLAMAKGITAGVGQGLAVVGLGIGATGLILPASGATDQATGDIVGFVGLGTVVAGVGVYALSTTADTLRTLAVPCAYGCFE